MKTADVPTAGPPAPGRPRLRLVHWLPVVLWMLLIFGFSTDAGSSRRTSRLIGPFLRWIHPGVTDDTVRAVQLGIRKTAHFVEYAVLAALLWRAIRRPGGPTDRRPWSRREAWAAVALAALFAATDEWHQSTVPSRQGQISDVLIDTAGAAGAMLVLWAVGRKLNRW